MSLSTYLKVHPPTKALFAGLPNLAAAFHSSARGRKRGAPFKVRPRGIEPIVVGTAFDYWLRAWLVRTWPAIPCHEMPWVAEEALSIPSLAYDHPQSDALVRRLNEVRQIHKAYVDGGEKILTDLLRGCLFLARLDLVYRAAVDGQDFFRVNSEDLEDLQELAALTMRRRYVFAPKDRIILNPKFGVMSELVGGADADLVIDDLLIDIKVSAYAHGPWAVYQRQLIGYWLLAAMEGNPWPIRRLGVYLAREGTVFSAPVSVFLERTDFQAFARTFTAEVMKCRSAVSEEGKNAGTSLLTTAQFERLALAIQDISSCT